MSRGTTLANLRTLLKAEIRDTQETNTVADAEYNYQLSNKQKDLAFSYDWEFLRHIWDVSVSPTTRYVSFPTSDIRGLSATINFERPVQVERFYNDWYEPICYGITRDEYNYQNSGLSEAIDPIQNWQFATNVNEASNSNQFEVWPIPVTAQTVRFTGQRVLKDLLVDADTADLDDLLIVYSVAADILAHREHANAAMMQERATRRLIGLRAGYPTSDKPIIFGKPNPYDRKEIRRVPIVVVA